MFYFPRSGHVHARGLTLFVALLAPSLSLAGNWSPYDPIPAVIPVPQVKNAEWQSLPIDAFVRSRLESMGLENAPLVDRRTWIRRVYFDLIGLPPTPEDVKAFVGDSRPDEAAYAEVVDRLLASPLYGERWGRHWLDVVRYADTDGFAIDGERPTLWRYRDYVIRAFNEDRPFNQFAREQLAGDELELGTEGLVATGFYRLGPWEADNMTPENRRQDFLNEMTTAVGVSFLGLTVGCARCHDHKYDPLPQKDFYRLQAFVSPVDRVDAPAPHLDVERQGDWMADKVAADQEQAKRKGALDEFVERMRQRLAFVADRSVFQFGPKEVQRAVDERNPAISDEDLRIGRRLFEDFERYVDAKRFSDVACTIKNPSESEKLSETFILANGDVFSPGLRVGPGFLSAITGWTTPLYAKVEAVAEAKTGRRAILADWIASNENPLTARVFVNRVWQFHFGQGIVATANDFGANGTGASHPELLDYLARWFIDNDWKLKPLHRMILLSKTYRQSTAHADDAKCAELDPGNRLLWRANLRRLEAETIRDSMLFVAGKLSAERGGPGFFEALPDEMEVTDPFFKWPVSNEAHRKRRSVYMFQRRNMVHPFMEVFDVADSSQSCDRRKASVSAPQALTLLNNRLAIENAKAIGARIYAEVGADVGSQVERLFSITLARSPSAEETSLLREFLVTRQERYRQPLASALETLLGAEIEPRRINRFFGDLADQYEREQKGTADADASRAALGDAALAILNSNEFVYVD